jgi:hypothetical protein
LAIPIGGKWGVSILALLAAGAAAVLSWRAYQTSYRPIVRVVPLTESDSFGEELQPFSLILKNIGRGPAISIVIVRRRGTSADDLMGEVDALEPLGETCGPDHGESARVGRVAVRLKNDQRLDDGQQYRVLYTDIAGGWHETEFKVLDCTFECRLAQRRSKDEIPA